MGGPAERAFGRVLRQLRRAGGLSQERLAEVSGCDRSYISLLERGINSPSLSTLFRLARALDLTPSALLGLVEVAIDPDDDAGPGLSP